MDDIALGIGLSGYAPTDWSMFKMGLQTQRAAAESVAKKKAKDQAKLQDIMKDLKIDYSSYKPYQFNDIKTQFASTINGIKEDFQKYGRVTPESVSRIDGFKMWLGVKGQQAQQWDNYEKQNQKDFIVDQEVLDQVYDPTKSAESIFKWGQDRGLDYTQDGDIRPSIGVGRYDNWLSGIASEVDTSLLGTRRGQRTVISHEGDDLIEASFGMSDAEIKRRVDLALQTVNSDPNRALSAAYQYGIPFSPDNASGPASGFLDLFPDPVKDKMRSDLENEFRQKQRYARMKHTDDGGVGFSIADDFASGKWTGKFITEEGKTPEAPGVATSTLVLNWAGKRSKEDERSYQVPQGAYMIIPGSDGEKEFLSVKGGLTVRGFPHLVRNERGELFYGIQTLYEIASEMNPDTFEEEPTLKRSTTYNTLFMPATDVNTATLKQHLELSDDQYKKTIDKIDAPFKGAPYTDLGITEEQFQKFMQVNGITSEAEAIRILEKPRE